MINIIIDIIVIVVILFLVCFGFYLLDSNTKNNNKKLKYKIKSFIDKAIINGYKEARKNKIIGIVYFCGLVLLILILLIDGRLYSLEKDISIINIARDSVKIIVLFVLFLILIGFIMSLIAKLVQKIGNIDNKKISDKMIFEFAFLLVLALAIEYIDIIKPTALFLALGLTMCYIINMQVMFQIIGNAKCIDEKQNKSTSLAFCALILLSYILIDLYLFVLLVSGVSNNSFTNNYGNVTSKWQLLYFTIISFTTTGYGDITPNNTYGQLITALIAVTSVICLVIFISSVLAAIGNKSENEK